MNGNDPHRYDDMLDLPRPVSKAHPPMDPQARAAQFLPFAALTGYDAAIAETARLTQERIEIDQEEKLRISGRLQYLRQRLGERPQATITYFQPDEKKQGGAYVTVTGNVRQVDEYQRVVAMTSGERIPMDEIIALDGPDGGHEQGTGLRG